MDSLPLGLHPGRLSGHDPDERGHTVATIVFALPILPGNEALDREMLERLNAPGPEKDAYVSARRAQGRTCT